MALHWLEELRVCPEWDNTNSNVLIRTKVPGSNLRRTLPHPVPHFLLIQNVSSKDTARSDIMKQKDSWCHIGQVRVNLICSMTIQLLLRSQKSLWTKNTWKVNRLSTTFKHRSWCIIPCLTSTPGSWCRQHPQAPGSPWTGGSKDPSLHSSCNRYD